jgi:hypothetical protein
MFAPHYARPADDPIRKIMIASTLEYSRKKALSHGIHIDEFLRSTDSPKYKQWSFVQYPRFSPTQYK